jgi:polar amino acid transport system ATP-binding protein
MPTIPDTPGAPPAVELPAISIQSLSKSFGTNEVLKDISLDVATGEVVCVIGPSGSGKSTLLRCVNMLETPTAGTVHVGADEMTDPDVDIDRVRRRIGMVFQSFNLFPHLTVLQNLTIAQTKVLRRSKDEAEKVARHNLERVGMTHKEDAFPAQLSGGQQQRVAVARALVMKPSVLLLDEPTGNLDSASEEEVLTLLEQVNREGATLVMVTHSNEVAERASRIVSLADGAIVSDEPVQRTLALGAR